MDNKIIDLSCRKNQILLGLIILLLLLLINKHSLIEKFSSVAQNTTGMNTKELTLFKMKGCPHCDSFEPYWNTFMNKVNNDSSIKFNCKTIDCRDDQQSCVNQNITAVPTLILYDKKTNLAKPINISSDTDLILDQVNSLLG